MGKPHEERKEEIIKKTLELAAEEGITRLTTQIIADRVGIAQSTIFKHFKTRDDIFSAAIKWISGQIFSLLEQKTSVESTTPMERLHYLINRHLALVSKHRGLPRLLFSDRLHQESPHLKKAAQEIITRYITLVSDIIREGIKEGQFRNDADPEETARCFIALLQGAIVRWSIFDFSFPIEKEGEVLWRFLWSSLDPHKEEVRGLL
ncbi:MAG: TetR/AcrR family transcriptional regulator [Thermodesulfovibrionia bacterium]|nr:TetR/AcrR family transcriptional regulator [Thermodesulfovibrionia bacterium]